MATTPFEQVQDQITDVYDALRAGVDEALEQARERAAMLSELAAKLVYAGVGAAVIAQERISHRVAELVN